MINLLLGIMGALLLAVSVQTWRLDRARADSADYEVLVQEQTHAAELSDAALQQCLDSNAENAINASQFAAAAQDAAARVSRLSADLYLAQQRISDTAGVVNEQIEGDCPAADDQHFGDWVYQE